MKLYTVNGKGLVLHAHNDTVLGSRGHRQAIWKGFRRDGQRMIAGCFKRAWQACKDALTLVVDKAHFAMHHFRSPDDLAAKMLAD